MKFRTAIRFASALRQSDNALRTHLSDFLDAYNFARRLKTLKGLTPYEVHLQSLDFTSAKNSQSTRSRKRRDLTARSCLAIDKPFEIERAFLGGLLEGCTESSDHTAERKIVRYGDSGVLRIRHPRRQVARGHVG